MKKKEPRNNVFRMIPLLLNDNILCLKFFAYGSTEHHTLFLLYFYGSVCLTHTLLLLLCVCMCVCVCVCVCARARARAKYLHTVSYKHGCKNSWITCSFKVLSCFLKPKLLNLFIDFKSFNFFWWIGPSTWCFTSASPWWEQDTTQKQTLQQNSPGEFCTSDTG